MQLRLSTFRLMAVFGFASIALGGQPPQGLDISWHTIDGGGGISSGGAFEIAGTIGQPDAGPAGAEMTGGSFSLVGGFWPGPGAGCFCPGDMNGDGARNGRDIALFTLCVIAGDDCACANVDAVAGVSMADVPVFVNDLLAGTNCP